MIRSKRAVRFAAAFAAASLVLTACGGEDDEPEASDNADSSETSGAAKGDGTLTIGSLLPQTGDLAFLGPPEFAGVDLAVEDINAAGGVLDQDVVDIDADSGDGTPDIAGAEVDKLMNDNADAIIGAAASTVSISVIDKITGAGVVQFSPANTAAGFDTYDDNGLYFRTAPSDRLQGQVLGNLAVEDGFSNVAIMARQDFYGEGLAEQVQATLEEKGATVAENVLYAADAQNYTAEVNKIAAAKPDALVLIGFEETTKIVPQLIAKGIGPQDIQTLLRRRQHRRLRFREVRPHRREGHHPGACRDRRELQRPAARDQPQAEGLQLQRPVVRRRGDHGARGDRGRGRLR